MVSLLQKQRRAGNRANGPTLLAPPTANTEGRADVDVIPPADATDQQPRRDIGECIVQTVYFGDRPGLEPRGVRVVRADEHIAVSDELLAQPASPFFDSDESTFTIFALNGTVVYRLGERGDRCRYAHRIGDLPEHLLAAPSRPVQEGND